MPVMVSPLMKKIMVGGGGGFPGNQKTPLDTPLLWDEHRENGLEEKNTK